MAPYWRPSEICLCILWVTNRREYPLTAPARAGLRDDAPRVGARRARAMAEALARADADGERRSSSDYASTSASDAAVSEETTGTKRLYASNDALARRVEEIARTTCRGLARTRVLGKTTRGRDVIALEIGSHVRVAGEGVAHAVGTDAGGAGGASTTGADADGTDGGGAWSAEGRLRFGFMGNMHGDEPVGREIALDVARWVCERATTGPISDAESTGAAGQAADRAMARRLVREAALFIVPTVNPDGFESRTRGNTNGVDLNRNFPYTAFSLPKTLSGRAGALGGDPESNVRQEKETEMIMNWSRKWRLNGMLNYHEGALVANYPWDGNGDGSTTYSASPDDETFKYLAKTYADSHPTMNQSEEFEGGITNGAAWYPLWGGMQDWQYVNTGTYSLTIEVDDRKWPDERELQRIVDEHVQSSMVTCARTLFGSVRGFVRDQRGRGIAGASVAVGDDTLPVTTDGLGFFSKPSAPSDRPTSITVTPPTRPWVRYPTFKSTVDVIDPFNGASLDVVIVPHPSTAVRLLRAAVGLVFVLLSIAGLRLRVLRRRRRVFALQESLADNRDIEKAIANRRGANRSSPATTPRVS